MRSQHGVRSGVLGASRIPGTLQVKRPNAGQFQRHVHHIQLKIGQCTELLVHANKIET